MRQAYPAGLAALVMVVTTGCGGGSDGAHRPAAGAHSAASQPTAAPTLSPADATARPGASGSPQVAIPATGSFAPGASAAPAPSRSATTAAGPAKPPMVQAPIPFGARRKAEMGAYSLRHYGIDRYRLINPQVIVEHFTETPDFRSTYNTFAPDVPDSELHELPGTCSHFVVDTDGTIYQLVALSIMCRHTVGLNWTAIGIEMVANSDSEILHRPRQLDASLALTRWLRCRFRISIANVIGHNESLSSPFHHENVVALRTQTHNDWQHSDMQVYRSELRRSGGCR
jgi:beta-N-acetylhexosaminidase